MTTASLALKSTPEPDLRHWGAALAVALAAHAGVLLTQVHWPDPQKAPIPEAEQGVTFLPPANLPQRRDVATTSASEPILTEPLDVPAAEPVVEVSVEPVVEVAAEPVVATVVEPVVEAAAEPVVATVAEPVVEAAAEPVVATVAEPVVEAAAEPVVATVVEPVVEAVVEPVVATVVEPAVEAVVEPVAATENEPVVEAAAEPVVATVVEPVVEAAAEQVVATVVEPAVEAAAEQVVVTVVEPAVEAAAEPVVATVVEPAGKAAVEPVAEVAVATNQLSANAVKVVEDIGAEAVSSTDLAPIAAAADTIEPVALSDTVLAIAIAPAQTLEIPNAQVATAETTPQTPAVTVQATTPAVASEPVAAPPTAADEPTAAAEVQPEAVVVTAEPVPTETVGAVPAPAPAVSELVVTAQEPSVDPLVAASPVAMTDARPVMPADAPPQVISTASSAIVATTEPVVTSQPIVTEDADAGNEPILADEIQTALVVSSEAGDAAVAQAVDVPVVVDPAAVDAALNETVQAFLDEEACGRLNRAVAEGDGERRIEGMVTSQAGLAQLQDRLTAIPGEPDVELAVEVVDTPFCRALVALPIAVEGRDSMALNNDDGIYFDGELLALEIGPVPMGGQIYVTFVDQDGSVQHLIPSQFETDTAIEAGAVRELGVEEDMLLMIQALGIDIGNWRTTEPFGKGLIMAFITASPLDPPPPSETVQADGYFPDLATATADNPVLWARYRWIDTRPQG